MVTALICLFLFKNVKKYIVLIKIHLKRMFEILLIKEIEDFLNRSKEICMKFNINITRNVVNDFILAEK